VEDPQGRSADRKLILANRAGGKQPPALPF
jgi:hypothetical protein